MRRARWSLLLAVSAVGAVTACEAPGSDPVTFAEYADDLTAICTEATEALSALPAAPEQIAVADLATSAASILEREATRADRLVVPEADDADRDLDGDHRAFVRNTREQADAWRALAAGEDLAPTTERIAQLVGGRNELVRSMGVDGCVRGGL
jgi:hypothetical protein